MQEDIREYLYQSWRPLVGYGAGGYAIFSRRIIRSHAIGFTALADRDPAKWGRTLCGIPVISPRELQTRYADANVFLVVGDHNLESARSDVLALGIPGERLFSGMKWMHLFLRRSHRYSLNQYGDLLAFERLLPDAESRAIFRMRYRHWLLGDRLENHGVGPAISEGYRVYRDAGRLCDEIDRWGKDALSGDIAFEFDNDDGRFAPRAMMGLGFYRGESGFRLGPGTARRRTRLLVHGGEGEA